MKNSEKLPFEKIKIHLTNESALQRFWNFLDRAENVDPDHFFREIDDSDYSMSDWVEAILGFETWLIKAGIPGRDFGAMLGYIHCCQMIISASAGQPNLQSIVLQCLADYGFEAGTPSQA